jgi:hypothetical protein
MTKSTILHITELAIATVCLSLLTVLLDLGRSLETVIKLLNHSPLLRIKEMREGTVAIDANAVEITNRNRGHLISEDDRLVQIFKSFFNFS